MRTMIRWGLAAAMGFVLLAAPAPAHAGPPWISVEYPTNPHHPSTRNASFLVRLYHHSDAIDVPVTGRAEGMVDGRRRVVNVNVERTNLAGVFAVSGVPKGTGAWVVVITMKQGDAPASALVTMAADGSPLSVRVPSRRTADGWVVPTEITAADVDAQLAQATAFAQALAQAPTSPASGATVSLLLLPLGLVAVAGVGRTIRRMQESR